MVILIEQVRMVASIQFVLWSSVHGSSMCNTTTFKPYSESGMWRKNPSESSHASNENVNADALSSLVELVAPSSLLMVVGRSDEMMKPSRLTNQLIDNRPIMTIRKTATRKVNPIMTMACFLLMEGGKAIWKDDDVAGQ